MFTLESITLGSVYLRLCSQSFTIHGLWPSLKTSNDYGVFKVNNIQSHLLDDMNNYWPAQSQIGRYNYFLWDH